MTALSAPRAALAALLLALPLLAPAPARAQDAQLIEAFTKAPNFSTGALSPDGEYVAFIVPMDDRGIVAVFRRGNLQQVGAMNLGPKYWVGDVVWVNAHRLLMSVAQRDGIRDTPYLTGELVAMNFDGSGAKYLTGERSAAQQTGTHIQVHGNDDVFAHLVGRIPGEPDQVLISNSPPRLDVATTLVQRMNVETGQLKPQTQVELPYADVLSDRDGQARFASGYTRSAVHQLWYRAGANADWQLINDEKASGVQERAIGFDAAQNVAYLLRENKTGPGSLMAYTLADGQRREVVRDARVDPSDRMYGADGRTLLAIAFREPRPRWHFLETAAPEAQAMRTLTKAFPQHHVQLAGINEAGTMVLAYAANDRDSGAFYLFDPVKKTADELIVRQPWLDPAGMAPVRVLDFTTRDGLKEQALLTLPKVANGAAAPLVVLPHGGPYDVADAWEFDNESQLLAAHGFAVLRVNFRGSGNYGRDFMLKGYRQWGAAMQDDLVDATRAAIAQGGIDGGRVCIYGASYGGYAALMAPAREPGLFKCAAGYVGVYDVASWRRGDNKTRLAMTKAWLADALGDDTAALQAISPLTRAAQIKVPVFLAAAGKDETVDYKRHSLPMREALTAAGNAPDWLVYEGEGHGYYAIEHQREFYKRLIAFLNKNLGVATAAPAATN
jgi:dipeptidyl aminopeptidase/acylaminoacyl peptidase